MARILIIKLGALGDVIIAGAAIRRLLDHHARDQVELLTAAPFAPLFEHFPGLDTLVYQRSGWRRQLQLIRRLRRNRYDYVYDLQSNDRSRVLTALSGARVRCGLWPGWPYNRHGERPRRQKQHPFRRINALLEAAGCRPADEVLQLPVSAAEHDTVKHWLRQRRLEDRALVLIHAGCSERWPSKRWPETAFVELAQALTAAGMQVIWIGGPDEQALNARLSAVCGVDAGGQFSIPGLIALAGYARFAVSNDSGPMHVLAAASIAVYSLFGPTDHRLSHALAQADRVFHADVDCSPCFMPQCPLPPAQHHRCMTGITPQQVLQRLRGDGLL